jgi:hypothetical protein
MQLLTKLNQISCQSILYVFKSHTNFFFILWTSTIFPPIVPFDPVSQYTPVSPNCGDDGKLADNNKGIHIHNMKGIHIHSHSQNMD